MKLAIKQMLPGVKRDYDTDLTNFRRRSGKPGIVPPNICGPDRIQRQGGPLGTGTQAPPNPEVPRGG